MPTSLLIDARALPAYDLGEDHPFAKSRQQPLFELLDAFGWLPPDELAVPELASDGELGLAHDVRYVDFVRRVSAATEDPALIREAPIWGLGTGDNPIRPGQHVGGAAAAGGTLACVREVCGTGDVLRAFNPAGGLHHAMPASASGFCIYNDLVVGIRAARGLGAERVAYIDFDVHHGDGVEHAFRDDPNVLTISFHESPDVRWPFTGRVTDCGEGDARGTIVNMPFQSMTADASWQACVDDVLRAALDRFRPDLLVTQHGADPHWEDPLAALNLTTDSFRFAATLSRELADQHCGGRWVATGGGGYQPVRVLPRAWAIVWATVSGRDTPERVDVGWRAKWREQTGDELPEYMIDRPIALPGADAAARNNDATRLRLHEVHGF